MNFCERIRYLLETKHSSINQMLKTCGLSSGAFAGWEKYGRYPQGDDLAKIADYFQVSVDYLLNRETPRASSLSPDEQNLISHFRALNPAGQEYIMTQVDYAMQQDKYKQESSAAKDA